MRLHRKTDSIIERHGMAVNQGLTHVAFFIALHQILPRGRHPFLVGGIVIPSGFIIHHPQPFIARSTVYIQSVDYTTGQQFPYSIHIHGESPFLFQQEELETNLGVLAVFFQNIIHVALNDHVLRHMMCRIIFLHRLICRHECFLYLRLISPDSFNRFGADTYRCLAVTMQIGTIEVFHYVMHKRTQRVRSKQHFLFLLRLEP